MKNQVIFIQEGGIKSNPFNVIAQNDFMLSNRHNYCYRTGITMSLPNNLLINFKNDYNVVVIGHYFVQNELYLILSSCDENILIKKDSLITIGEIYIKEKVEVKFIKNKIRKLDVSKSKKIESIDDYYNKAEEVIEREIKKIEAKKKDEYVDKIDWYDNNVTIRINASDYFDYSQGIFNLAKKYKDILYIAPTEMYKNTLMETFIAEEYKGRMNFYSQESFLEEIQKLSPFPKIVVMDNCNDSFNKKFIENLIYYKIVDVIVLEIS